MTERSVFWATTNVGDGPSAGYSSTDLFEVFRSLFTGNAGTDYGGVSPDYLNQLVVTGTSSPVSVGTGAAIVYGVPYFSSAAVSVTIPTPVSATRIDRIVLRASWSAQTVRITRIAGVEGGAAPAITQNAGVTWDVRLAVVSITTAGVITVSDEREFVSGVGDLSIVTAKLANAAVTTAKLADSSVTSAKIADGAVATGDLADAAVTTAKLADAAVTTTKVADANITTAKIADSNITTAKVADDAITNAKLANMSQATVKGRASGAGLGDPVDLTAAQVVGIVATADGAGSGLDADLLDGNHASAFAVAGHTHDATTITDGSIATAKLANDAVDNSKLANMAQATIKGRASGAGTGDPVDLTPAQAVAILTSADGTGSGLDADLLDGNHAGAFATSGHVHTTTWTDLTLQDATASSGNGPQYRLNGDMVEFRGSVRISSTIPTLVAVMPGGYIQPSGRYNEFPLRQGSAYIWVTGANIYIYNGAAGNDYNLGVIRYSITA